MTSKYVLTKAGFLAVMVLGLFVSTDLVALSADCRLAYERLAAKQEEYVKNPPAAPLLGVGKSGAIFTPMNGGQPFKYEFSDLIDGVRQFPGGSAIGIEISFKNTKGETQKIEVIGAATFDSYLDQATGLVLDLPPSVLEATRRVEVRAFQEDTGKLGSAIGSTISLFKDGVSARALYHEFGHTLATYTWGRSDPFSEWRRAFKKDGSKFISEYAESKFKSSKFSEDFAEAVAGYLHDANKFRRLFPNRAALLDTIFRDQDLWAPVREHNHTVVARLVQMAREKPVLAGTFAVVVGANGAAIINLLSSSASDVTPQPTPAANSR